MRNALERSFCFHALEDASRRYGHWVIKDALDDPNAHFTPIGLLGSATRVILRMYAQV